ncbi:MAG: DUF1638 domain-containing protein [Methanosarcina flavescens]
MELGLHRSPKELKIKVYETIKALAPFSSGILLFYGLCGNVLGTLKKTLNIVQSHVRSVFLKTKITEL